MEEDIKNNLQIPMKCGLNKNHHYLYVICWNKINELIIKEYNDRNNTR